MASRIADAGYGGDGLWVRIRSCRWWRLGATHNVWRGILNRQMSQEKGYNSMKYKAVSIILAAIAIVSGAAISALAQDIKIGYIDSIKIFAEYRETQEAERLYRQEVDAWTVWLRGMITSYGRLVVRNKLESDVDRIRLGFEPFVMFARDTGRLAGDLEPIYNEFHPPGQHRAIILINDPPMPPLNAARVRQPSDGAA